MSEYNHCEIDVWGNFHWRKRKEWEEDRRDVELTDDEWSSCQPKLDQLFTKQERLHWIGKIEIALALAIPALKTARDLVEKHEPEFLRQEGEDSNPHFRRLRNAARDERTKVRDSLAQSGMSEDRINAHMKMLPWPLHERYADILDDVHIMEFVAANLHGKSPDPDSIYGTSSIFDFEYSFGDFALMKEFFEVVSKRERELRAKNEDALKKKLARPCDGKAWKAEKAWRKEVEALFEKRP